MGWREEHNMLVRDWQFEDFASAWEFACQCAEVFEQHQHHPDMTVGWGKVRVETTTHEVGGMVTEKDWALAEALDELEE